MTVEMYNEGKVYTRRSVPDALCVIALRSIHWVAEGTGISLEPGG